MSGKPPVYGTYSQTELNRQYDAAGTVPSADSYFAEWAAASERARGKLRCELDVAYGSGERERLDLFPAARPNAPLFIFFHGGYWRRLDKSYFSFVAGPLVGAGAAAAIVNHPLVATATLDQIVAAARHAFVWIARNAGRLDASPSRIVVGGHSAGGQIAGMLGGTDWTTYGLPSDSVKGVFAISGLFDLEPVRLSHVNEWLNVDAQAACRNSPIFHLPRSTARLIAAVGGDETVEFKRQSSDYARAWSGLGFSARFVEREGFNHFTIVLELADAKSSLTRMLIDSLYVGAGA